MNIIQTFSSPSLPSRSFPFHGDCYPICFPNPSCRVLLLQSISSSSSSRLLLDALDKQPPHILNTLFLQHLKKNLSASIKNSEFFWNHFRQFGSKFSVRRGRDSVCDLGHLPAMASQCQCLSLQSRFFSTTRYGSSTSCGDVKVDQPSVFLRNQRFQPNRRLPRRLSHSPPSFPLLQCVSSSALNSSQPFSNNGDKQQQTSSNNLMSNLISKAPEPIRVFPWGTAGSLFVQRGLHQCWSVGKWLAMPVLAVSMLSELSYTFLQEQVLIVPAGMLGGIAFAGMMKDTALELSSGLEVGQIPWHLVLLGSFFGALKFIGPYLPTWGRVSVPHFANGGLWHVIKLVIDWRKQHADRTVKRS